MWSELVFDANFIFLLIIIEINKSIVKHAFLFSNDHIPVTAAQTKSNGQVFTQLKSIKIIINIVNLLIWGEKAIQNLQGIPFLI